MHKLIKSSADPEKVSLTVKGVLVLFVPFLLLLLNELGVGLTENVLLQWVDASAQLVGGVAVVWGVVRKLEKGQWSAK